MNCPKCGYELTEGHLYCDRCGEEIRIVPDFEPEIEREMTETLATLFVELAEETSPEIPAGEPGDEKGGHNFRVEGGSGNGLQPEKGNGINGERKAGGESKGGERSKDGDRGKRGEKLKGKDGKTKKNQGKILGAACLLLLAAAVAGTWGNYSYRSMYSVEYQIQEAEEEAALERYTQAITWMEKAFELDPGNAGILFQIADYYDVQGKNDMVLSTLEQIIQKPDVYGEEAEEKAYEKTIEIYGELEKYEEVNQLLKNCGREDIVTQFQQFLAKPPEFSYEGGRYNEMLSLKLSANTSGTIYYTLDGTRPDKYSTVYTAPIFLEVGSYVVTAFFVNDYGIESEAVSNTYHIEVQPPAAPEVSVYSGEYWEPHMIEAEAPEGCTVYYTADGSEPTIDSPRYAAAISMPLGESVFKFIAVSPEGAASEVTECNYNLVLHTDITTDMAVDSVIRALMRADVLLDESGKLRGMSGRNVYKYNAVVRIAGSDDYYVVYEYYEDATGIQSKTERMYGVDVQTGIACRITYDEDGRIVLVDI